MLKSLTVSNFALIENATVDFSYGFNVLTGETGAGKSILIDALNAVLGGRTSSDLIRTGTEGFRVEAVFDISMMSDVIRLLADQEINPEEDGSLIISRRVTKSGKNSVIVNGCHVTLGFLRSISSHLVDMYGQHENQSLLRQETYLPLLDCFEPAIGCLLKVYMKSYKEWLENKEKLANLNQNARNRAQRIDLLSWQINEISHAILKPGEEEELLQQIRVLSNTEKIIHSITKAYSLLYEDKNGQAITTALAIIQKELENAVKYDERLTTVSSVFIDAIYQVDDCASQLRQYLADFEFEPNRLAELQERMDVIYKLKQKYGNSIAEVLMYLEKANQELNQISNYESEAENLIQFLKQQEEKLADLAEKLTKLRSNTAQSMSLQITKHLSELGMSKAIFEIVVSEIEQFGPKGKNQVNLFFSANPGEAAKHLQKVASGGELSRIALAIKAVSAARDHVNTMIFDEVDSGIGGKTAQMVAEKIAFVASEKQETKKKK